MIWSPKTKPNDQNPRIGIYQLKEHFRISCLIHAVYERLDGNRVRHLCVSWGCGRWGDDGNDEVGGGGSSVDFARCKLTTFGSNTLCYLRCVHEPTWSLAVHVLLRGSAVLVEEGQSPSRISTKREALRLIWIIRINIINIYHNSNCCSCLVSCITFLDDQRLVVFSLIILVAKSRNDTSGVIGRCS